MGQRRGGRISAPRTAIVLLALALIAGNAPGAATPRIQSGAGDALSIERIFKEPRLEGVAPRAIAWSPNAAVVAYLWSDERREARDLWLYDASAARAVKLTDIQKLASPAAERDEATAQRRETMRLMDEGVDSFLWAPDGRSILFTFQGDLFLIDAGGGEPRRLTRTASPE